MERCFNNIQNVKVLRKLNFEEEIKLFSLFLPLIEPLVDTFNETGAPASRKHIIEQGVMITSLSQTLQFGGYIEQNLCNRL